RHLRRWRAAMLQMLHVRRARARRVASRMHGGCRGTRKDAAMSQLILKRASLSRSSGQWSDDDYDVFEDGVKVGRIFNLDAVAPEGRPWMWASGHNAGGVARAAHGYAASREEAMAAFAKSWRRE